MKNEIKVENLNKAYQQHQAVSNFSFSLEQGKILGLLGPNGAGKSTTINILSTVLKPDSGKVTLCGYDLSTEKQKIKKCIGIVPQELAIYEEISAEKNVSFFASLYGLHGKELKEKTEYALQMVGLTERKKDKPKTFSGGMKRRLNIACAIAHQPQIIIMDEPTVGIDPQSRNHILEAIMKLKENGSTILYSTHYMEEVEQIADRILIMDKGQKIAEGTLNELLKNYENSTIYHLELDSTYELNKEDFDFLLSLSGIQKIDTNENVLNVTVWNDTNTLGDIFSIINKHGYIIKNMSCEIGNLETVFLDLTGRTLRD